MLRTLGGRYRVGVLCTPTAYGGSGGMPPQAFFWAFRPSEVISGAFSDHITCAEKALGIQLAGINTIYEAAYVPLAFHTS